MPKEKTPAEARDAEDLPTCGKGLAENAAEPRWIPVDLRGVEPPSAFVEPDYNYFEFTTPRQNA